MNAAQPGLDQLRELPLPPPVPYFPATWGWVVVALLAVVSVACGVYVWQRRRRRNRYRRQALAELARIQRESAGQPLAARQLPDLLKRTALAAQAARPVSSSAPAHARRRPPKRWTAAAPGAVKVASSGAERPGGSAALVGDAWLAWLEQSAGKGPRVSDTQAGDTAFPADSARMLAILAYAPDAAVRDLDPGQLDLLFAASRRWMAHHHLEPQHVAT